MSPSIKVENLSKRYRLGLTHSGSIRELVNGAASRLFRRKSRESLKGDTSRVDDDGNFWALKDINFEINAGEVVGIIGRNGAGKSTLLKILSRITLPSSGRIEMRGRVASLLEVGTGFHPELTGRENVYMNGTILGMTKQEIARRFDAIVDFAGVETFVDTPVKRYSSGMTVRLGFAVAAHLEPEILIVDEVLAVGDAEFQKRCMGKLDDVARSGRTVLFVSHNIAAIEQLTGRCLLIEGGHAVQFADTQGVLERYSGYSKSAVSEPAMVAEAKRCSWAGDQSVRFVYAEILTPSLQTDQDIRLRLGVKAKTECEFRLGITICGRNGVPVAAGFCAANRSQPMADRQIIEVDIRNPGLAPGNYWFTLGLLCGSRDVIDAVDEILHFEVLPQNLLPDGVHEWNPSWGHIRLAIQSRNAFLDLQVTA